MLWCAAADTTPTNAATLLSVGGVAVTRRHLNATRAHNKTKSCTARLDARARTRASPGHGSGDLMKTTTPTTTSTRAGGLILAEHARRVRTHAANAVNAPVRHDVGIANSRAAGGGLTRCNG